jgi:WD40 repeat protein
VVVRRIVVVGLVAVAGLAAAVGAFRATEEPQPAAASAPEGSAKAADPFPRTDREGVPLPAEALARVGSARLRHGGWLNGLEYSPDGSLIATCGGDPFAERDYLVKLWDARTGKLLWKASAVFSNHPSGCPFSADGKMIVIVDGDTCRWFDTRSGRSLPERDLKLPEGSINGRISPDGSVLATLFGDQTKDLVVYDLPSGRERFRKSADGFSWYESPVFSLDGKTVAMMEAPGEPGGSNDFRARLFDLATGRKTGVFEIGEHFGGLSLSPDGKQLAAHSSSYRVVRVWSVPDGKLLHAFVPMVHSTETVSFAPDAKSLVVGSQDSDAVRIDLATGKELNRFRTHHTSRQLVFAPDGKRLAIGNGDGNVFQWDLIAGKRLDASADLAALHSVHFDAAGDVLQFWDDAIVSQNWRSGREARRVPVDYHGDPLWVLLSPDLSRMAAGTTAWDAVTGKQIQTTPYNPYNRPPADFSAFSADGKTLYYSGWDDPVGSWDADRGLDLPILDKKPRRVAGMSVSGDGRRLAIVERPQDPHAKPTQELVTVCDLTTRRELRTLKPRAGAEVTHLVLSPDGSYLAAAGYASDENLGQHGMLEIWDTRTGKEWLIRTDLPRALAAVAFSGDGRTVATGSSTGELVLWEVATRSERHRFTGHENAIHEIAFSRGDRYLASTSCDAPIYVWDVEGHGCKAPSTAPFTAEEAAALWQALDSGNATAAFDAMRRLLAGPKPALALLRDRLKPARALDTDAIRQALHDLDADTFSVRQRARADLELIADQAAPALHKALDSQPSIEAKRRIEDLLAAAEVGGPCRRREIRAVEVAERIGTAEARDLINLWNEGAKDALLTSEAHGALDRLKRR